MGIFLTSIGAFSAEIDSCLTDAKKMTRIIDKRQSIESCFQIHIKKISQHRCYELTNSLPEAKKNQDLSETLNSICFYQTTDFPDIKTCTSKADLFKVADNHDEAIFDCYRQLQSKVSQKQCIEISRKLIYPEKKSYMLRHCQNNY